MIARGTFDVSLPAQPVDGSLAPFLGARLIDKRFAGDLVATSRGLMLAHMTPVQGSAGYVAIERVTGTLAGRTGEFTLQHHGLMHRGAQSLDLVVIPDSGTGELEGLVGAMRIIVEGGAHSYEFDWSLPAR